MSKQILRRDRFTIYSEDQTFDRGFQQAVLVAIYWRIGFVGVAPVNRRNIAIKAEVSL